jgi:hypothetical protein
MANSKGGYNAVGQAAGPRRNTAVSPSSTLDGASRPSKNAMPRQGNRVPAPGNTSTGKARPGGTKGQGVQPRKGTANISRPGR